MLRFAIKCRRASCRPEEIETGHGLRSLSGGQRSPRRGREKPAIERVAQAAYLGSDGGCGGARSCERGGLLCHAGGASAPRIANPPAHEYESAEIRSRYRRRPALFRRRAIEAVGDLRHWRRNICDEKRAGGYRFRECVAHFTGPINAADEHGNGYSSGRSSVGGAGAWRYAATPGNRERTLRSLVAGRRENRVLQGQRSIRGEQGWRRRATLADICWHAELLTIAARWINSAIHGERSTN